MKKTRNKKILLILILNILILNIFTGCNNINILHKKSDFKSQKSITADKIWKDKIRYLSQTDCKDFDNPHNLKKEYLLKVCQYYKTLSYSNIEYNESINKYIISAREVAEIIYNLFGILDFEYDDKNYYDKMRGFYFFSDYISFFDDETYEYQEIIELDDERLEFNLEITDQNTNLKKKEKYILKKDEKNNYYVASKETL